MRKSKAPPVPLDEAILQIRAALIRVRFAIKQQSRCDRALESFVARQFCGLSHDDDKAAKKKRYTEAQRLISHALDCCETQEPVGDEIRRYALLTQEARKMYDVIRKENEEIMRRLARELPVWEWVKDVKGVAEKSLATIVGGAGDLESYGTVSRLWKRLGLAVIDGVAQGKLPKGTASEVWIRHGYNRMRRAEMWNVGACLIKAQIRKAGPCGAYGEIYTRRKAIELERGSSKGHAHRRAQRVMEKAFIKHLWIAWNRHDQVQLGGKPKTRVSADSTASLKVAAE